MKPNTWCSKICKLYMNRTVKEIKYVHIVRAFRTSSTALVATCPLRKIVIYYVQRDPTYFYKGSKADCYVIFSQTFSNCPVKPSDAGLDRTGCPCKIISHPLWVNWILTSIPQAIWLLFSSPCENYLTWREEREILSCLPFELLHCPANSLQAATCRGEK